jgi:hypothetical protein
VSYTLSVASRFALPQFTSEPVATTAETELAGAVGLIAGLDAALGEVADTVVLSDVATAVFRPQTENADTFVLTDVAEGERFRRSDFRHIENSVWLDDAIELVTIMD